MALIPSGPGLFAAVGGFLTALARFAAYVQRDAWVSSLHQWLYPVSYHRPHAGLPLPALGVGAYRPLKRAVKTPA
jgi:hypothetical protein